jgi:ParB/RepB/Spo0J family partition protein
MDTSTATEKKPSNGKAPIAAASEPTPRRTVIAAIDDIQPSDSNPRKKIDPKYLEELAGSIKALGVLQNPLVRKATPRATKAVTWELILGECRWRAAKKVGLVNLELTVVEMSDVEVLEAQLHENLERRDITELEEGEAFQELIRMGRTAEYLIAKTGKSKSYVYGRLKLAEASPAVKKALADGKLPPSHALLIARMPVVKLQDQAVKDALEGRITYDENNKKQQDILPYRELAALLQKKYMLRLADAPFSVADAQLVPAAGACGPCPKKTGNQAELFADAASPDLCTDPVCFDAKRKADWDRKAAGATRDGMRVLNDKEAAKVFTEWQPTSVAYNSPYVDPKDKLPHDLDPSGKKTWGSLAGDKVPKVLCRDGAGAARVLIDRNAVVAKAKKDGSLPKEVKAAPASSRSMGGDSYAKQQKERQKAAKLRRATATRALGRVVELGQVAPAAAKEVGWWRWLASCLLHQVDAEDLHLIAARRGIEVKKDGTNRSRPAEKAITAIIRDAKTAAELRGLVVEFAAAYHAVGGVYQSSLGDNLKAACDHFGVDAKKLQAAAIVAEQKAKADKQPAGKPAKKGKTK